jgi:hypothetical protein
VLKELKGKSDSGPRKPHASLPVDVAADYGRAAELYRSRKYQDALAAFEALVKKSPSLRLAGVGVKMASAKLQKEKR